MLQLSVSQRIHTSQGRLAALLSSIGASSPRGLANARLGRKGDEGMSDGGYPGESGSQLCS